MVNEQEKAEIKRLFDREKDVVLKIQGCILKGVRLDELYIHGTELVSIALRIQYHCARISVSASQEIPERKEVEGKRELKSDLHVISGDR